MGVSQTVHLAQPFPRFTAIVSIYTHTTLCYYNSVEYSIVLVAPN
jgi:hypothetical protein